MKKKLAALMLAAALSLSLAAPALAAEPVFQDVPEKHWAASFVERAYHMGIVNGTSWDPQTGVRMFSPDQTISGAEICVMLTRQYCPDEIGKSVQGQPWYTPYVEAAEKNGYLTDVSIPNMTAPATREQMVAILYNAAGRPAVDAGTVLAKYTDRAQLSAYAVQPMAWAVSNGVVSGTTDTTLSPAGTATRAQIAVVMVRYIENELGVEILFPTPGMGPATRTAPPTPPT